MRVTNAVGLSTVSPAHCAVVYSKGNYYMPDHILQLNAALIQIERGQIDHLIIMMPPRHGKSFLTSQMFPAWYLNMHPDRNVIFVSYEADFAASWGKKAREVYLNLYANNIPLKNDSNAGHRWETMAGGGMFTAGIGGSVTGRGAHILLIDDPVKNSEEAHSKTMRDKTYDWFQSTALTRLEAKPNGAVIVIMTRWHEDDLVGRLLAEDKNHEWKVLNFPAINKEGEALFPQRFPREQLAKIKQGLGEYFWNSLYMQSPTPRGAEIIHPQMFKKVGFYKPASGVRYWDVAVTTKTYSDYSAGALVSLDPEKRLVIHDMAWGRWQYPDLKQKIIDNAILDGKTITIGIEEAGQQRGFIDDLCREPKLGGYTIRALKPEGDKLNRAMPWASRTELGHVVVCEGFWNGSFFDECLSFTASGSHLHDDQIDAVSGGYQLLQLPQLAIFTYTPEPEQEEVHV